MSEVDPFAPLVERLDHLVARIEPGARQRLAGAIATDLRASNAKRLKANIQPPEDEAMTARKPHVDRKTGKHYLRSKRLRDPIGKKKSSVKQERMFQRAGLPKYLRKENKAGEAQVGFAGAMARIMRVHQYGLSDHVTRSASSALVKYPKRTVLGIDAIDRKRMIERVMTTLES